MKETDYQIVLIIITIIGFIISTAFYVYFVYLPATRAEDQLDVIAAKGEDLISLVNKRTDEFEGDILSSLQTVCDSFKFLICTWNVGLKLPPIPPLPPFPPINQCNRSGKICILDKPAYPEFCQQIAPFNDTCDCPNF